MTKKIYSYELAKWVESQVPSEIIRAMLNDGWNVFGIYELVKEGLSLERKGNLTSKCSGRPRKRKFPETYMSDGRR